MVDARHFAQGTSADPTPVWQRSVGALQSDESQLRRLYTRTSTLSTPRKAARLCWRRAAHGIGASPILLSDSTLSV